MTTRLTAVMALSFAAGLAWMTVSPSIHAGGAGRAVAAAQSSSAPGAPRVIVTTSPGAEQAAGRELLPEPGVVARPGLASPTRVPWVTTNGWHFVRNKAGKFRYELPAGKGVMAAAEAAAYNADVLLQIDAADAAPVADFLVFQAQVPALDLPDLADFGVVDDGAPELGEVMNLLVRRNLLFQPVKASGSPFAMNVKLGTKDYPKADAADPSKFALKVRHILTDEKRRLRIYGSEVTIGRLIGDATHARLYLLNYGQRETQGMRIRVRGTYPNAQAYVLGAGKVTPEEIAVADGATEFSMPAMTTYAVVDLSAGAK
jgi:hypothetical protein